MKLYAPKEYWNTPDEILDKITGGCGPGGWGDFLVPDNIDFPWPWGLSIRPACRIHDWYYGRFHTLDKKEEADRVFLNNMVRIIEAKTKFHVIKWRRKKRAWLYYTAVKRFGAPAFFANSNEPEEMGEVSSAISFFV